MNTVDEMHPSANKLAAFGLGQLDEAESAEIECHVASCAACRLLIENLPADSFVLKLRDSAESGSAATSDPTAGGLAHEAPTLVGESVPTGATEAPPTLAGHPRYQVLQVLGAGGMGTVYKAVHQLMERPVALKIINPRLTGDPAAVERFRREVKGAARLTHPNIVTAYDAEQAGDLHFLVMEYVEGQSLDKLVQQQGALPVIVACDYARQVALGLQHAFERGLVHRDIKPHNLMRTRDGQIKILDFGLARFVRESEAMNSARADRPPGVLSAPADRDVCRHGDSTLPLTQTGSVLGTPDYMAPEQAVDCQAADIRADLYSLGCTLYFLLTGTVPFPEGSVVDKLLAHAERIPKPLTSYRHDIPGQVVRVVERLLAKDPSDRFATPAAVADALYNAAAAAPPAEPIPSASAPVRRRRTGMKVATGFTAAAVLLGVFVFLRQLPEDTMEEYMTTLYTGCALLGGTLLACQFLMSLFGLGHHHDIGGHEFHDAGHAAGHDADHDANTSWLVGILTFRTVVAALTFFGLAGRAAMAAELPAESAFGVALAAGAGALFLIAWMMRSLYSLKAEGTVRIQRSVGQVGTVYLPIPGHRGGAGKVHLNLQSRTVEYQAVTASEPLATGTQIRVVAVVNSDTVEVIHAPTPERISHV
jgi:hypothetical protein